MKSKISKILITVGLLICVGSLSIKGYSKYLENKSTKSFEEKIDKIKTAFSSWLMKNQERVQALGKKIQFSI